MCRRACSLAIRIASAMMCAATVAPTLAAPVVIFIGTPTSASAGAQPASPTPSLMTGNYIAPWSLLAVEDPSLYSRNNVAAGLHATTIHYDAVSQSYVLSDGASDFTFSANERVSSQSTAAYSFYRDSSTGATLRLLNDSPSNPLIALTYVTYGRWGSTPVSPLVLNDNYVVFGAITPAASFPRTGSATYRAIVDGTYQNRSGTYGLSGSASFLANFGTGILSFNIAPVATSVVNSSQIQFGQLSGQGYIDSSHSSFAANTRYDGVTRFVSSGYFFGPQVNEIGGAFTISSTLGGSAGAGAGTYVGKKN